MQQLRKDKAAQNKKANKSQAWLALFTGISTGMVSQLVSGRSIPTQQELALMCAAFMCHQENLYSSDVLSLIKGTEKPEQPGGKSYRGKHVLLTDELAAEVDAYAKRYGLTRNEAARALIIIGGRKEAWRPNFNGEYITGRRCHATQSRCECVVVIVQLIRKSLMVKGGKKWFYDKGTFKTISDVLAFKVAGTYAYVVKNAAYFELRVESASGFFYSNIPVDLTPIQKIKFSARNVNGNMYVGVQPNNSNVTGQRSVTVTSTSFAEYVIDVSDLTGNYYLVGGHTGGNTTKQVRGAAANGCKRIEGSEKGRKAITCRNRSPKYEFS